MGVIWSFTCQFNSNSAKLSFSPPDKLWIWDQSATCPTLQFCPIKPRETFKLHLEPATLPRARFLMIKMRQLGYVSDSRGSCQNSLHSFFIDEPQEPPEALSNFNGRLHHTQAKHEFAPIENPFSGVSDIYSSDQLDNLIADIDAATQLLSTQPPNHDLPIHQMSNMHWVHTG